MVSNFCDGNQMHVGFFNFFVRFLLLCVLFSVSTVAQRTHKFEDDLKQDVGCEMTAKLVEYVFSEALERGETVFVISRSGKTEKKSIGWLRLEVIENRFKPLSDKLNIIVSEGRPAEKGLLEFWIGSKPRAAIRFGKNQRFCIDTPERGN